MTTGENIRRIRKMRGLTQKDLGSMLGVSEAFIRAQESGRRNPKEKSLQAIADALDVNIEVLRQSDFDGIEAMHMLFQIARQYGGTLFEIPDESGDPDVTTVCLRFNSLSLMRPWMERYNQYTGEVEKANSIKDVKEKISALEKAENSYDMWMDMFPSQVEPFYLGLQKQFDDFSDYVGLNPKNEE